MHQKVHFASILTHLRTIGFAGRSLAYWMYFDVSIKHRYVSKFHLRQFLDPDSMSHKDPWLWQGFIAGGPAKRRAPKNVGTKSLMFNGPGGLANRESTLEIFLANQIEGPAAHAIREFCARSSGSNDQLPPALTRYLAWAAARSLPMQQLFQLWASFGLSPDCVVEPPSDALMNISDSKRDIRMVHPSLGARIFPHGTDRSIAIREGC